MSMLTPSQLLALHRHTNRNLAEVAASDPALFAGLDPLVSAARQQLLLTALPSASDGLRALLSSMDLSLGAGAGRSLLQAYAEALATDPDPDEQAALEGLASLDALDGLDDPGAPNVALREHPVFQAELRRAAVAHLASAAGVPDRRLPQVLAAVRTTSGLTDGALTGLVDAGSITHDQASIIGLHAVLHHVAEDTANDPVAFATGLAAGLVRQGITEVLATARMTAAEWAQALRRAKVTDHDADEVAVRLERAMTALRPTDALMSRLPVAAEVEQLHQLNPDAELLALDYTPDSDDVAQLNFGDLSPQQRTTAVDQLRSYQRMFALTDNVPDAAILLRAGYASAVSVAVETLDELVGRTKLPVLAARNYHRTARDLLGHLSAAVAAVADAVQPSVHHTRVEVDDYLRRIPGFATLFGNQDYCDCEHCGSILSPAAYFVDLLRFVEEKVRRPYFVRAGRDGDALDLKTRRPDLWQLELTCENTTGLVRHLDLANEVMEDYLVRRDDLANRDMIYARLATSVDSFRQPFTRPLAELTAYLPSFNTSRAEIVTVLTPPNATPRRVAARLGLSIREHRLITHPQTARGFLSRIYGHRFSFDPDGVAAPTRLGPIRAFVGLRRQELGDLVGTHFVTLGGSEPIRIVSEKRSPQSVQNDVETLYGLRVGPLDRLHRMARLARVVPWSIEQLDLVLTHLGGNLNELTLSRIAAAADLGRRFSLPVEQNCALWSEIPSGPLLFDRIFNSDLPAGAATLPSRVRFLHPSLRADVAAPTQDDVLHRLRAGLAVTDPVLVDLIRQLAGALGADLDAADESRRGFELSAANLALLYRHARLLALLDLTVMDLFTLIDLAGLGGRRVSGLADLDRLLDLYDWMRASGYTLAEVLEIIAMAPPAADPTAIAGQIVESVLAESELEFADTLFAFLPGVTESESRRIVGANGGINGPVFEAARPTGPTVPTRPPSLGVRLRLRSGFGATTPLVIPSDISASDADVRDVLAHHHVAEIVPARLTAVLGGPGTGVGTVRELIAMAGLGEWTDITAEFGSGQPPTALARLVAALLPLSTLFRADVYDPVSLAFLRSNPSVVASTGFTSVSLQTVRNLTVYSRLASRTQDKAALHEVLLRGIGLAGPAAAATALGLPATLLATLLPHMTLPADALAATDVVDRAARLADRLGIDGQTMAGIASDEYPALTHAAAGVLAALQASYASDDERSAALDPVADHLAESRRDALTDYLIRSVRAEFTIPSDISEYLLVDCEIGGCARTSRVVAATSSVQLYVERVRLNLEQNRRSAADPRRVAVPPAAIPDDEWAWRKFYRVWEANRKIFLWPENYLEPSIRDDKTPLFTELEATLLQEQISDQKVLDGYAQYLTGLDEVAHLALSGACHEKDPDDETDVLHLFAVTPSDPPVHYYRTIQNAHYGKTTTHQHENIGAWRRVDVAIPVRVVSPVIHNRQLYLFWTEVATTHRNQVVDGTSTFAGYRHRLGVKYTMLRLDGTWSAPQPIAASVVNDPLKEAAEQTALDDALRAFRVARRISAAREQAARDSVRAARRQTLTPRYGAEPHREAVESYSLTGFQWDRVYPQIGERGELRLTLHNFRVRGQTDFYRQILANRRTDQVFPHEPTTNPLLCIRPPRGEAAFVGERPAVTVPDGWLALTAADPDEFVLDDYAYASVVGDRRRLDTVRGTYKTEALADRIDQSVSFYHEVGAVSPQARLTVVQDSIADGVIDLSGDLLYLQGSVLPGTRYLVSRLSTTLVEPMRRALFTGGVGRLLAVTTQESLEERAPLMTRGPEIGARHFRRGLDVRGGFGTYFQEVFFHVPFLLAAHLNAAQQFQEAMQWYQYIFDPTSDDAGDARDRVWRYLDFRGRTIPSLRTILTDSQAISAYRSDPLNPYAIARLRPSAFQKCVVMRYVDNLIDWGDSRFTVYTPEAVTEATALYSFAGHVLGPRPDPVGSCGEERVRPRTYERIASGEVSEFLYELENLIFVGAPARAIYPTSKRRFVYTVDKATVRFFTDRVRLRTAPGIDPGVSRTITWNKSTGADRGSVIGDFARIPEFGWSVIRQIGPAFCVPMNPDLREYWDRVEDRLYKIRHCLDIDGMSRELPLFAPEIDPHLLVLARAQGLSIEEVVGSTSGDLPPYRFTYLLEKARQHASLVQSFGSALQSALEKKDAEELANLRAVHQHQMETLNLLVREREVGIAEDSLAAVQRQTEAAEYRQQHFGGLLERDLTAAEQTQQASRHTATALFATASGLGAAAATARYVANVGSPFAMTYGGEELGEALKYWSEVITESGRVAQAIGDSAGLEAGFERRREEWEHQRRLATHELRQLSRQARIAEFRLQVARRSLRAHQRQIDQSDEILSFYGTKFSNAGRYTWLAGNLQRLYREAYQSALATARLAEQAFRFERGDQNTPLLGRGHYDAAQAGLLAGERLLLDLETMERRFIETNYRTLEIDQTFALGQIAPAALLQLRETGTCDFTLPEVAFDLQYPGQYLRRIRAVRLTVPCVAGPYVNVPVTFTLIGSRLRREPRLNAPLVDVPPQRSITIATSKAQNDAGVFEFSFRDERYMPFEGAGAVDSAWRLSLPEPLRSFDYRTIADVLVHIHYTADHDQSFSLAVQDANAARVGTILHQLASAPVRRLFSLRHDFSSSFARILRGEPATITITERHLPYFMQTRPNSVTKARLVVSPAADTPPSITLNDTTATSFVPDAQLGGLPTATVTSAFRSGLVGEHTIAASAGPDLTDIQILVELTVT